MENILDWDWFIKKFEVLSKIDLKAYKRPQMERRINSFMRSVSVSDYKSFVDLLNNDKIVYRRFLDHITINVSEFFRNANHWEVLEKEIIPMLLKERNSLKVWSAGCSTGEEPYSLAILFQENGYPLSGSILATDLDDEVLEKAGAGLYSNKAVQGLSPEQLKKYFESQGSYYRAKDELKKIIRFQKHDLLKDPFPRDYDLILCRNVVIYFTEPSKFRLYERFATALRIGGVIFIGSTEQIFQARELNFKSIATFFYQKY
ncbi:MAG: protein-glutamate O-methyltransferase CheR [Syntrophomonas sp.]|uniref:CheR family methyltransferase n=1 Tax=Syntrophomonas sp. TaxID=2053627 RepID=UPI00262BD3D4|nr:protein-glutamate O-methyltransferase CheR [Syntrophomonas sp.]MDD2510416.1 protein-glutamate O-methyltransferase CheR [Syntrophomonas sp.]MDD3878473.1 protein-glutamate O-methyltransferase CheR [Syntrophomonas sp.]MDD4625877.1 protein-glutamate O-methyltransferase CheR [Syntrophomonas sp.]